MTIRIEKILESLCPSLYTYQNLNSSGTCLSRERFSKLLLEHGEKDLQDWKVLASSSKIIKISEYSSNRKFNNKSKNSSHEQNGKKNERSKEKTLFIPSTCMGSLIGRLRICSKSILFESTDPSRGIIRCPFDKLEEPPKVEDQCNPKSTENSVRSHELLTKSDNNNKQRIVLNKNDSKGIEWKKLFVVLKSNMHFIMKKNNIVAPYENVMVPTEFRFLFIHSNPHKFLELSNVLYDIAINPDSSISLSDVIRPMIDRPFDPFNLYNISEVPQTPNLHVSLLSPLVERQGCTIVTNMRLYFQPSYGITEITSIKPLSFKLSEIFSIARRYYGLKDCALEIFFSEEMYNNNGIPSPSVLLAFDSRSDREKTIVTMNRCGVTVPCHTSPDFVRNVFKAWCTDEISNFQYLLALNSAAGRSFHDFSRYPVFPWVIADYESSEIDINADKNLSKVFRDMTKPVGALNADRLDYFKSRYNSMQDKQNAFLYGTHYMAPGYVLYYLIRSIPEHMLCLQNGKYDTPDRIFHSLYHCYSSVLTNPADVKELIPQFYDIKDGCDFLNNVSSLQLGCTQNGLRVNDVKLPPWANSPKDFVRKNRMALESKNSTRFLPSWIDLIFGEKSRGDKALEAMNLFHPAAYHTPIDLEKIPSKEERLRAELHATEFGIVPDMLFCKAHPEKHMLVGNHIDYSFIAPDNRGNVGYSVEKLIGKMK